MTSTLRSLRERWLVALAEELPAATDLRHRLHTDPRVSGEEADTAAAVVAALGLGAGVQVADTGRAVLVPAAPSTDAGSPPNSASSEAAGAGFDGVIALRAELDALAVIERTDVPWASTSGAMHACGHDVHLAALVALCRAARRIGVPVPILALLQPREESAPSGAADMVASGLLTAQGVRAVIGAHLQPRLPRGVVSAVAGPVNASSDEFEVVVTGQGGHAGYPHALRDPVLALCQVVVSLQQIASRRIDPIFGAVCSISQLRAGTAANVVPDRATAVGSLRLMRAADREVAHAALLEIAECTARAHGCTAEVRFMPCEPVLHNDVALTERVAPWLSANGSTVDTEFRSFGADDFAHYCATVPGLMMFVGLGDAAPGAPGLHDERFLPGDGTVEQVAHALIAGYLAALGTP